MKKNKHIEVAELEIPLDYFTFSKEEKEAVCNEVMDAMLHMLDKHLNPEINRIDVLDMVLQSSIVTNLEEEKYEVVAVLTDIRTLINE